ncbi:MAG: O-acetyl-ADP-ribose deacetylase [Bacteroidia bacterium]|nr:O-acetyl-ADP-ribose deacetylase [Bacteroidia bacterium]
MKPILNVVQGDITKMTTDAIVNAANSSLLGGGGVDGAIHRAAGPELLEECRKIRNRQGTCKVGEAVITGSGRLPCQYVIHTVGPHWNGGTSHEEERLANCYKNSMLLAEEKKLTSIAFPNISTGIYRFPKQLAVNVVWHVFKSMNTDHVRNVDFVCFDDENFQLYANLLSIRKQ